MLETRSVTTAMDWSLVLASQDIGCSIEAGEDRWHLLVAAADYDRAAAAIRAFEEENATVWRQEIKWTGLVFDWRALIPWLIIVAISWAAWNGGSLQEAGIFDTRRFHSGEWWRCATAVTLHKDAAHLALNAATGLVLLGLAMAFYGPAIATLAAFMAGAAANIAESYVSTTPYLGLGASGMVMGALGLLAAQSLFERHHLRDWIGRGLLAAALLLVLIGLDPKSDVLAHVLGFIFGILLGIPLCLSRKFLLNTRWLQPTATITTLAILFVVWTTALHHVSR